jgi:hypothetical protein
MKRELKDNRYSCILCKVQLKDNRYFCILSEKAHSTFMRILRPWYLKDSCQL